MFSINIYLRIALIVLCIGGGLALAFTFGFWYAFPFLLIGLFLFGGYLLLGTVQSTALLMQKMDFVGAQKRLNLTLTPRLLYSVNRAYYYLIKGGIAMQMKEYPEAEASLLKAQSAGLPSDNEKAMVSLQLANIAAVKNNWQQAQLLMKQVRQMKVTEPQLKEQIVEFDKGLKNQGAMKTLQQRHRGSVIAPGGKRRRPRAR